MMNRFILSTVLLAFSATTLADLSIARSGNNAWVITSDQSNYEMSALTYGRKPALGNTVKSSSAKQLYIPATLKDARKIQNNKV